MRIALIQYSSKHTVTGGYIYNAKLVEYLQSQGALVKIFLQQNNNFMQKITNNFSRKILKAIQEFDPHFILEDEMNFISLLLLNRKLKSSTKATIISLVHLLKSSITVNVFAKFIIRTIEKFYCKTVDGFIFNSHSTREEVEKLVGKNNNALVAYPGKDRLNIQQNDVRMVQKDNKQKLLIIFVGNVMHNKGLHILLHALAHINPDYWNLSVIGGLEFEPRYVKKILSMITCLNLHQNVHVLGMLDSQKLKLHLIQHHLLVVPSFFESYGMVYAEAMGAGIPVIASNTGGTKEIVTHNMNGFLINPGDIDMLRQFINKVISDRSLLSKMSRAALNNYKLLPSWQDTSRRIYNFLQVINYNK